MSSYPKISRGLGKLTPDLWARLMKMLKSYELEKEGSARADSNDRPTGLKRPYFLANITGSSSIVGEVNRYHYSWTEVILDTSNGFGTRPNGRSGTTALNLCEMDNDVDNVGPAVDLNGSTYPANFSMRAIGSCIDGTTVEPVVVMFSVRDTDGVLRSVFSLANDHDGTC